MSRSLILGVGGAVLLAVMSVCAHAGALVDDLYGRGTHVYFSGDLPAAHELFTASIEGQSGDPRPYYFRGLVYLKLGRPEEAALDFQNGARREMADANTFYDVSRALERIQGEARLTIEQYRATARAAAMKRAAAVRRARYEAIRSQEDRVLRKNVVLTPPIAGEEKSAETVPSGPVVQPKSAEPEGEPAVENPFEAPSSVSKAPEATSEKAAPAPAKEAPAEADPFAAGSDPFAVGQPAEQAPAQEAPAKEAPAKEASPKEAPAEPDPFAAGGDTAPAKEAPAKEEPPKEGPAKDDAESDPFAAGGDTAPPKEAPEKEAPPEKAPPAPAKEAPAESDPFTAEGAAAGGPATATEAPAKEAPAKEAPPEEAPPKDDEGAKDPFAAAPSPGIEPPTKAAGQTPVTRPATGVTPVPAIPVSRRQAPPAAAKSTASEATASAGKSTDKPDGEKADENPFVEEP